METVGGDHSSHTAVFAMLKPRSLVEDTVLQRVKFSEDPPPITEPQIHSCWSLFHNTVGN